jgi:hypothetical protein
MKMATTVLVMNQTDMHRRTLQDRQHVAGVNRSRNNWGLANERPEVGLLDGDDIIASILVRAERRDGA